MTKGKWVRGGLFALIISAVTLSSQCLYAGFEVGNGWIFNRGVHDNTSILESFEGLDSLRNPKTEFTAPDSDGVSPRTRVIVYSKPLFSAVEDTIQSFLALNMGWRAFYWDGFQGVHREREVTKDWNVFEMQLFGKYDKFFISLRGNKNKSVAYKNFAAALLSEIRIESENTQVSASEN